VLKKNLFWKERERHRERREEGRKEGEREGGRREKGQVAGLVQESLQLTSKRTFNSFITGIQTPIFLSSLLPSPFFPSFPLPSSSVPSSPPLHKVNIFHVKPQTVQI
jgi:hypothetical protein